jgi:hypothetical protein
MGGKKAGGGFLGIGGESGFLNTGILGSGPKKIKGFEINEQNKAYEQAAMDRQAAIAAGTAPSIAQMQLNQANQQATQQALAMAASQRGASNPALAFRQAQIGNQQMGLENAQAGAIMAEQERRAADQFIAQQVSAQRGLAFNQDAQNLENRLKAQKQNADSLVAIGGTAAKASGGGGK